MDSLSKLHLRSVLNLDLRKIHGKNLNSFHWGMGLWPVPNACFSSHFSLVPVLDLPMGYNPSVISGNIHLLLHAVLPGL